MSWVWVQKYAPAEDQKLPTKNTITNLNPYLVKADGMRTNYSGFPRLNKRFCLKFHIDFQVWHKFSQVWKDVTEGA